MSSAGWQSLTPDGVSRDPVGRTRDADADDGPSLYRPAMLGVAMLTAAYLGVLFHVTNVVGGTGLLVMEVAAVLLVATLVADRLAWRRAVAFSVVLFVLGLGTYYFSIPPSLRALFSLEVVVRDVAAMLTGLSVLRLLQARIWVLSIVPAPLFASWVLAIRGRYGQSVTLGGIVLGFLVLTGDADVGTTLLGVVGATLAVGLGTLDVRGALSAQWDTVALVVATMVVVSATLSVVPAGGATDPLLGNREPSLESTLVSNDERVTVVGSISLSPKVRFVVESERSAYWRVGAYDRYTGDGWVRTGELRPYDGPLDGPVGDSRRLEQTITAKSSLSALPAAWKPVEVDGSIARVTEVTSLGGLRTLDALRTNESYTVISRRPDYDVRDLRTAGTDYPASVRERYLQLPRNTPERVERRAATVTADAETPYEAAVAIEQYLERTKEYSLSIERPGGSIADAFLFEMDAGYCVYFATTMVVMLRTQGIPARFVTGYTPGQQISSNEYVVRGLDAHAWVEVYFPDVGWVRFDPTPGGARESAEQTRIEQARENDVSGVDAAGSAESTWTPTPLPSTPPADGTTPTPPGGVARERQRGIGGTATESLPFGALTTTPTTGVTPVGENSGDDGGSGGFEVPNGETLGYGAALVLALAAGARRLRLVERGYRLLWLHYQPRVDPETDAERAYDRLETLLERRYRGRRPRETPRTFLSTVVPRDGRATRVLDVYEKAHYGGGVPAADAERAVSTVDEMVRETTPILGRIWKRVAAWRR